MSNTSSHVLITGAAGFVGFHLSLACLRMGYHVTGIDTLNAYYDVQLKHDRLSLLKGRPGFRFVHGNICDKPLLDGLFAQHRFDIVVNLAAQAGVRYSIERPYEYIDANLIGFINILEACRQYPVKHLLFASSSSVYGNSSHTPHSEDQKTDAPVSLYAATKKANELMAHSYAHLYGIPATGLRFFSVYGPWGRPDMAYFSFTNHIVENKPITLYHRGQMRRDFTYIDDVVRSIMALLPTPPASGAAPFDIFNIGNHQPVWMYDFIAVLEQTIGKKAVIEHVPFQNGDVNETFANTDRLSRKLGFAPQTTLRQGLRNFVDWYVGYYGTAPKTKEKVEVK
ncbi:MAG: NAD-dependent epimerase/dehydratase family protein [Breznakibacter sp.]